jgi:glutamyl-tRNA synthetase
VRPRGRYAPSPTGPIHLGNARSALVAWLSVRRRGGVFIWREEDLDPPRVVPGMAAAQRADLAWLGLDWDEGPDVGGGAGPYRQSERSAFYEAALAELAGAGRLFPCRRSRRDLAAASSAPHGPDEQPPYPAALRPRHLDPGWYEALRRLPSAIPAGPAGTRNPSDASNAADPAKFADAALRFRVEEGEVRFADRLQGEQVERVDRTVGDFVLKRRDGLYAYQLAVVVDDLRMGIDEVVRGADLLASTARQIALCEALGGTPPAYAHVPLVLDAQGGKLSKRDAAADIASLRAGGAAAEQVVGYLAWSLGLLAAPAARRAADLVPLFAWRRLGRAPFRLPADPAGAIHGMRP